MPVESATFISQLVPANPLTTDPIAQGDDQLRLLKSVLQSQFTNLGTTAVTATADQINAAAGGFSGSGSVVVPPNGSSLGGEIVLQGVSGSGAAAIYNDTTATAQPGLLEFTVNDAGNTTSVGSMQLSSAGLGVTGQVFASTVVNAPSVLQGGLPIFPSGGIILWAGSVASIPSGWVLCDGTNGTPDLRNRFLLGAGASGGFVVPGQTGGATSAIATTTTAGAHTHTGSTGSAGAFTVATDAQGAHSHTGSTASYTLTTADIPSHSHGIALFTDVSNTSNLGQVTSKSGSAATSGTTQAQGGGGGHAHGISTDGAHAHNVSGPNHTHSISSDGDHSHSVTVSTVPVFYALAYIMKS